MRKYLRPDLAPELTRHLEVKQHAVDNGADGRQTWERARPTKPMAKVVSVLRGMSGPRERCMYCEDSRGTDVDHFWPLARYPDRIFLWPNLLLCCAACNRQKGDAFHLGPDGAPLLVDPTALDPWDFLFYDSETDNITARYHLVDGRLELDPRGEHTLRVLRSLKGECAANGRGQCRRNLRRAVLAYLARAGRAEDATEAEQELLESLQDNNGYGVLHWYLHREGRKDRPFSDLREKHPSVWMHLERAFP